MRITVNNCMDVMTTSPAESQNNMLKSEVDFVSKKIPWIELSLKLSTTQ